jgi:hypothetical protein
MGLTLSAARECANGPMGQAVSAAREWAWPLSRNTEMGQAHFAALALPDPDNGPGALYVRISDARAVSVRNPDMFQRALNVRAPM